MQRAMWRLSLLAVTVSWATAGVGQPPAQATAQEVKDAVHSFLKGFDTATCDDGTSVSKHAKDQTIYVTDAAVYRVPLSEYEAGVKERACGWSKHRAAIDEIVVDVHGPNVATAAWTWHDEIVRKDGSVRRAKGAVMQVWVKVGTSWKLAATKGSEAKSPVSVKPAAAE